MKKKKQEKTNKRLSERSTTNNSRITATWWCQRRRSQKKEIGKKLTDGAIGMEDTSNPNAPPGKKKKAGNPLKKELSNPQGLDFANQAGALMAQPQKIEMLPPKDMTKEATRPEKTTSGVKNQSMKMLRTKANVFDATMQGRRSFTFEYEGT